MSFGGLLSGSGTDCGPVNPLSQLSKAYNGDRGVQQDHFNPVAGSSTSSGFRGNRSGPNSSDEAALFFHQQQQQQQLQLQQQQHQQQVFDLQSLNRNLPNQQQQQQSTPAWAQAFSQSMSMDSNRDGSAAAAAGGGSAEEQELFRRAFGRPQESMGGGGGSGGGQLEWRDDFVREREMEGSMRNQNQQDSMMNSGGSNEMMMRSNTPLAMIGRGNMGGIGGMSMGMRGMGMLGNNMNQMDSERFNTYEAIQNGPVASTDWETAFLAQESITQFQSNSTQPQSNSTQSQSNPTQSEINSSKSEIYQRPRSPLLSPALARDALAQTAGELLNTVANNQRTKPTNTASQESQSQNDKFANSTFLDLMRKLRDGEVAVEGDKVVEQIGENLNKGKGKAWSQDLNSITREEEGRTGAGFDSSLGPTRMRNSGVPLMMRSGMGRNREMMGEGERQEAGYRDMEDVWHQEDQVRESREGPSKFEKKVQFQGDGGGLSEEMMRDEEMSFVGGIPERSFEQMRLDSSVPMASSMWEEDYDASMIAGGHALNAPMTTAFQPSEQQKEWDVLQGDWDNFEATATGFKPAPSTSGYVFASSNPYLNLTSTRTHALHTAPRSTFDSILEKEAAVQRDPLNPQGWLALGIKQQENEREDMAIQALNQALSLDPSIGEAYLALAVSYTNENERAMSYGAIDKWIDALGQERYPRETDAYRDLYGPLPTTSLADRHDYLTGLLIRLARSKADKDGEDVDADVQIGLGVLFNASEEYDKAGDCFESALSVRPDDPLLFNRLGATLANSGKTELAIQYYVEALEIQPTYVRARFNLAVANMNLAHYNEAVEHLLTALAIQEADSALQSTGTEAEQASSVATSQTLWDSLNTALLMLHRSDLATHAIARSLTPFRSEFPGSF